jgi:RNA 3'-terminal phosphate cyclase (ATP)
MIEIDGSFGEGGGQILRSSLALALLTSQSFCLRNIRAKRDKPGLRPQHLMSVLAAAEVGRAETRGASVGSTSLEFKPQSVRPGDYHFRIGTAGATGLVLHTVHLPLALQNAPSTVTIEGGTHNDHSPCFHFLATTWREYMARLGLPLRLTMGRPGFYPRGGGKILANIPGRARPQGLTLTERRSLTRVRVLSAVASLPEHITLRQAEQARNWFATADLTVDVREEAWPSGPGTMLAATFPEAPIPTLFFALGARGKRAEAVADEAAEQALDYFHGDAPVDPHTADQLVLPLAFADGPSEYRVKRVTQHLLTNIAVVRYFVDREITCDAAEGAGHGAGGRLMYNQGMSAGPILSVAQIVPSTDAEGPGRRYALWFQGCPLRCPGCCNPEMLPFEGGTSRPIIDVLAEIHTVRDQDAIEGISLLGGEPLAHAAGAAVLARGTRALGLSVMVFSGYTLAEARSLADPAVADLLAHTDILVDGPYIRELPDNERRWIGSTNQRIHFLTDRYRGDDPCWRQPNTLEVRLRDGELTVNGFPAKTAVGLWKRPVLRPENG